MNHQETGLAGRRYETFADKLLKMAGSKTLMGFEERDNKGRGSSIFSVRSPRNQHASSVQRR